MANKLLVTGIDSGLGKYLHRRFQCDGFARDDTLPTTEYDAVIHCAVSTVKDVSHGNLNDYVDDNVSLTKKLCSSLYYKKFIYISTVDVYPKKDDYYWKESDEIVLNTSPPLLSLYATTKLMSEAATMMSPNWLILRCSTILNVDSRHNCSTKVLDTTKSWPVFLHGSSDVCFILASDIATFIEMSLSDDLTGIYNLAGTYSSLAAMADIVGSSPVFGEYVYSLGKVNNKKACSVASFFNKTLEEAVEQFIKERQ